MELNIYLCGMLLATPRIITKGLYLTRVYLPGAYLQNVDLQGADLFGAQLNRAELNGAKLCDADLSSAHIEGAILIGTDLSYACLCGMHVDENTNLAEANWWAAKFTGPLYDHSDSSVLQRLCQSYRHCIPPNLHGVHDDVRNYLRLRGQTCDGNYDL